MAFFFLSSKKGIFVNFIEDPMPLLKISKINDQVAFALWQIDEELEELISQYELSAADQKILAETKIEQRKKEWLSARLALNALVAYYGLGSGLVYKDDFGKPHLKNGKAHISISHTKGIGAAAISFRGPVGIDVEHPRAQILRIAKKFLHSSEVAAQDSLEALTQIWAGKEALYKLHGRTQLIFAEQLLVQSQQGTIIEEGMVSKHTLHFGKEASALICVAY